MSGANHYSKELTSASVDNRDPNVDIGAKVQKTGDYYIKNGEFSDVWLGILERDTKGAHWIRVAIKVLRGAPAHNRELHEITTKKLNDASKKWKKLDHPNILTYLGVAYDFSYLPAMISKYCEDGNIVEYIEKTKPKPEGMILLIVQIMRGLAYLHERNIVHGDLRGANILVDDGVPVLADFGVTFIIDHSEFTTNKIAGPARWTAPEVLDPPCEDETQSPLTKKSDIFAFAMTVIEIFTGKPPFNKTKNDSSVIFQLLKDKRPNIPESIQQHLELQKFLKRCWAKDPTTRPDAKEALFILEEYYSGKYQVCVVWSILCWMSGNIRRFFGRIEPNDRGGPMDGDKKAA